MQCYRNDSRAKVTIFFSREHKDLFLVKENSIVSRPGQLRIISRTVTFWQALIKLTITDFTLGKCVPVPPLLVCFARREKEAT